jgi:Zn finger protein HypA/HybF involved in hydrogenase expression
MKMPEYFYFRVKTVKHGTAIEVENASDADVVEVVRCKDCKYAEYIDDVKTLWCTECGQGRTVAPNDFCSYAERRKDG